MRVLGGKGSIRVVELDVRTTYVSTRGGSIQITELEVRTEHADTRAISPNRRARRKLAYVSTRGGDQSKQPS